MEAIPTEDKLTDQNHKAQKLTYCNEWEDVSIHNE